MPTQRANENEVPSPKTPQTLSTDRLLLDADNPRLASGENSRSSRSQKELLKALWTEMAVDEVALSIAANGFFPEEPLLVIPHVTVTKDPEKQTYVVVEGNRRLAAVKLLRDPALRAEVRATSLPILSKDKIARLSVLPVSIYNTREELWAYFGFRHINGPMPWDAYSKAEYVAKVHEEYHKPIDEIARRIGDQHATVKRFYRGYNLLRQAETMAGFSKEDRIRNKFYFSHLYTAVDQPDYQKFLGITAESSLKRNPVPKKNLSNLRELLIWIYGSKSSGIEPLIRTQSPDINTLREVIRNPAALAALRSGYSLQRSHEIGVGDEYRFRIALTRCSEEIKQAKGTVSRGYNGEEDLFTMVEVIVDVAESIQDEMIAKRHKQVQDRRGRKND